jgi:uncharacterized membrane protein
MAEPFFNTKQAQRVKQAIADAENQTSGEIRVHIEKKCKEDVLDHAAYIFGELDMHKTDLRNGVLFYVSYDDHKLAILGDGGINAKVADDFWESIKENMIAAFKAGNYADGLSDGIRQAGEQLKKHFPYQSDDENELSNEISYGKDGGKSE